MFTAKFASDRINFLLEHKIKSPFEKIEEAANRVIAVN